MAFVAGLLDLPHHVLANCTKSLAHPHTSSPPTFMQQACLGSKSIPHALQETCTTGLQNIARYLTRISMASEVANGVNQPTRLAKRTHTHTRTNATETHTLAPLGCTYIGQQHMMLGFPSVAELAQLQSTRCQSCRHMPCRTQSHTQSVHLAKASCHKSHASLRTMPFHDVYATSRLSCIKSYWRLEGRHLANPRHQHQSGPTR